jgi:pimeloyl-ACP methyl ester carboxylesterase
MAIGSIFEPQIAVFSKRFRVIAPDSRGHGKTDNPSGELSYRLMADDMAAFMDALGFEQASVCGWSDGGQIALELGMHYPGRVSCMVVGAAWYRFSQNYQDLLGIMGFESPGSVNIERIKQSMPQWVGLWRSWHSSTQGPDYWEILATQISTMWWTPLNYTADDFQKIKCPTLILVGDKDQMVPVEEAVEMYRLIPEAELAVAPDSDHSFPRSRAELFSTIVFDFLVRHRIQATAT